MQFIFVQTNSKFYSTNFYKLGKITIYSYWFLFITFIYWVCVCMCVKNFTLVWRPQSDLQELGFQGIAPRLSGLLPDAFTADPSSFNVCHLWCLVSQTYCISQDKFINQNQQQWLWYMINCTMVEGSERESFYTAEIRDQREVPDPSPKATDKRG